MSRNYERLTVKNLVEDSSKCTDVLTLEATVITGFEYAAVDECKEKCGPLKICKAQGRIFFNIPLENYEKVSKLRSVDNLLLVNDALGSIQLSKEKENDLEVIKSLVHKINWERTLATWATLLKFEGTLFPTISNSITKTPTDKLLDNINQDPTQNNNENISEIQIEVEELNQKVENNEDEKDNGETNTSGNNNEEINDKSDQTEELENKMDQLHISREKLPPRISESSDDVYFSADEEIVYTNNGQEKKNLEKTDDKILKFRATCNRVGDHSFSSMEAAAYFGGALNDKFQWKVDLTNFDLNVILNINKDIVYVCSAITERSMHRRNITHFGYVTLRSTMCYNLVRLAEPVSGEVILDPLCGGGSIPIEGSLGFPKTYHICGDNDEKAVNRTLANVAHLMKSQQSLMVDTLRWTARKLPLKDSSIDVCVTDLPFGRRSGKKADNLPLYKDVLTETARVSRCGTARAVFLTHDKKSFTKAMSGSNDSYWRQIRTVTVNQGGLFSTVFLLLRTAKPFMV